MSCGGGVGSVFFSVETERQLGWILGHWRTFKFFRSRMFRDFL